MARKLIELGVGIATIAKSSDHDERPKRHWTEFLNNDDESQDRDDDWEWERQDDFGDSWDGEKEES